MRFAMLSVVLLASCATGTDGDADGVIKTKDARVDTHTEDDTSTEEDTAITDDDTGTIADTGSSADTSVTSDTELDTRVSEADSGSTTTDTGSSMTDTGTVTMDTGTTCTGEEPEPNDTSATARALGTIDDCDGSGKSVAGVISSSSDVDVWTFDGTDTFGCSVNPTVKVTGSVTVCVGFACKSGTTVLNSCTKGTKTGSQCCGTDVEADVNCTGTTTDSTKVTITVKPTASTPTCAVYSLAYHY
jgi:hypothetical protein